jgi:syntaxin 16
VTASNHLHFFHSAELQGHAIKNQDLLVASGVTSLKGTDALTAVDEDIEAAVWAPFPFHMCPRPCAHFDLSTSQSRSQLVDQELLEPDLRARDHELTEIAKSIATLAELFKDLSSLVIDQGTLLDSVEYNIEQTGVHMNEAVKELEIATRFVPSRVASDTDSSLIASPSFSFWFIRSTGTRRILAGGSASSFSCSSSLGSC